MPQKIIFIFGLEESINLKTTKKIIKNLILKIESWRKISKIYDGEWKAYSILQYDTHNHMSDSKKIAINNVNDE